MGDARTVRLLLTLSADARSCSARTLDAALFRRLGPAHAAYAVAADLCARARARAIEESGDVGVAVRVEGDAAAAEEAREAAAAFELPRLDGDTDGLFSWEAREVATLLARAAFGKEAAAGDGRVACAACAAACVARGPEAHAARCIQAAWRGHSVRAVARGGGARGRGGGSAPAAAAVAVVAAAAAVPEVPGAVAAAPARRRRWLWWRG